MLLAVLSELFIIELDTISPADSRNCDFLLETFKDIEIESTSDNYKELVEPIKMILLHILSYYLPLFASAGFKSRIGSSEGYRKL